MNCRKAREYIQRQLDDELTAGKRLKLVRHLGGCADCRQVQEQSAVLSSAFDELAAHTGGRPANRMLFNASRPQRWKTPLSLAAAIALMLGASTLIYNATSGRLFSTAHGPRVTHMATGEAAGGDVTRTIASARWSEADFWTWAGVFLVLIGLGILVIRLGFRSPAVFMRRVYQRSQ